MKKPLLMFSFLTLMGWTYAQNLDPSVITPAGGIHGTDHLSLEWTLGEMAVEVIYTENKMITEGYHQPTFTVSDYPESNLTNTTEIPAYQITVFPNPATSLINVQIQSFEESEVSVGLFNILGEQQFEPLKKSSFDSFEMDLSDLPFGIYLLRFNNSNGKEMKTFKISKIN